MRNKLILAFLVLILVSIAHLYHDFNQLQMMDRGSPPKQELQYMDSIAISTTRTSSAFKSLNEIAKQTKQVFITMPAKAAGSTMKDFANMCSPVKIPADNLMNYKHRIEKFIFTDNYEVPSVIPSHIKNSGPFIDLLKGGTRETLIIYIHREELSRVRSAAQYVLMSRICCINKKGRGKLKQKYKVTVGVEKNRCTIDEKHLIRMMKNRSAEIRSGAPKILTCNYFDAIAQNDPSNLVFVDYKQANKLQTILAKKHCPHIVKDLPIASNVAVDKEMEPFVRLSSDPSREVTFKEWFNKKQNVILWALDLKKEMDCQSKIMEMEDHLFSCPDEAVMLIHGEYQCVSLSE
jgi:hypothetical protein